MNRINIVKKLNGGKLVEAYSIIGCNRVVVRAWELTIPFSVDGGHSSVTTFDKVWYGKINCRSLPKSVEEMPVGKTRFEFVDRHHKHLEELSRAICKKAYNKLSAFDEKFEDGEYVLTHEQFAELFN